MERKKWLEDAIEEHVTNNPGKDSVDLVTYFKLRADITLESLGALVDDGKIERKSTGGVNYGYFKKPKNLKEFNHKDVTIRVYTDAYEYLTAEEAMEIPEGAEFAGVWCEESQDWTNHGGFCTLDDKLIRLYIGEGTTFREILALVGHELGHIVEGGFKKNPPDKTRYSRRHEQKACHYEIFSIDVYDISMNVSDILKQ
jgi:hypothetical protein